MIDYVILTKNNNGSHIVYSETRYLPSTWLQSMWTCNLDLKKEVCMCAFSGTAAIVSLTVFLNSSTLSRKDY